MSASLPAPPRPIVGAALLACLIATVCGCGGAGDPPRDASSPAPSVPLYSEAVAAAVARGLLAGVPLPADTRRVTGPPAALARLLGRPLNSEDHAKAVDRHAYWSSSRAPTALLAFVAQHGPAREVPDSGSGSLRGRTYVWWEILRAPSTGPLAGPREVFVTIVAAGHGRYAVRVDALAAWHRRRPTSSLVPLAARWLRVQVTPARRAVGSHARHNGIPDTDTSDVPTTDTSGIPATGMSDVPDTDTSDVPDTVRAVARLANELPLAELSGAVPSCPAMPVGAPSGAARLTLTFRASPTSAVLARVRSSSGYVCARAGQATTLIVVGHRPPVALTDHLNTVSELPRESFARRVELALRARAR